MHDLNMLIVRSYGSVINLKNYNAQEIGLAKAFVDKGIKTDIVLYAGNEDSRIQEWIFEDGIKINIYWLKGKQFLKHGIMPEIYNLAAKYDLLWLDEYDQYTSFQLTKKFTDKVYIYHGPYPQHYSSLRFVRDVITSSIFFRKKLAKKVQVFTKSKLSTNYLTKKGFKNVATIGVGLDTSRFAKMPKIDFSDFGINEDDQIILYIGTIDERRNTVFLLQVFKKLYISHSSLKLVLIGKANDKYWEKCRQLIEKEQIESRVIHIDRMEQEKLPAIYNRAEVFMLPTKYDIFGMVLLEAMYFGIPVVSSNNGGSSTLIQSGYNGYICDFDVDEWFLTAQAIITDKTLRKTLGDAATKTITEGFTWDKISDKAIAYMKEFKG